MTPASKCLLTQGKAAAVLALRIDTLISVFSVFVPSCHAVLLNIALNTKL
jgi:hypothetical protein